MQRSPWIPPPGASSLTRPSVGVCFLRLVLPRPRRLSLSGSPATGRPERGFFFEPFLSNAIIPVPGPQTQATLGPAMAEHSFAHRTGKPCQTFGGASSLRFEALHAEQSGERSPESTTPPGGFSLNSPFPMVLFLCLVSQCQVSPCEEKPWPSTPPRASPPALKADLGALCGKRRVSERLQVRNPRAP